MITSKKIKLLTLGFFSIVSGLLFVPVAGATMLPLSNVNVYHFDNFSVDTNSYKESNFTAGDKELYAFGSGHATIAGTQGAGEGVSGSGYLGNGSSSPILGTGSWSMSFWVKVNSQPAVGGAEKFLFEGGFKAGPSMVRLFLDNPAGTQRIVLGCGWTGWTVAYADYTFVTSTWYNITIVNDDPNDDRIIYVDGVQVGYSDDSCGAGVAPERTVLEGYDTTPAFTGHLDELVISDTTVFTTGTISDIYNSGAGVYVCLAGSADCDSYEESGSYHVGFYNLSEMGTYYLPQYVIASTTSPVPRENTLRHIIYFSTSTKANSFAVLYNPVVNLNSPTFLQTYAMPDFLALGLNSTSSWVLYTEIVLYDSALNLVRASSAITWTYEFNPNLVGTTSTPPFFTYEECPDALWGDTFWSSFVCHVRNITRAIGNVFLVPKSDTLSDFRNSFEAFKATFPAVFIWGLADKVTDAIASSSDSDTTVLEYKIAPTFAQGTTTLPIISSSSITNGFGQSFYNTYANYLLAGMIGSMLVGIVAMIAL